MKEDVSDELFTRNNLEGRNWEIIVYAHIANSGGLRAISALIHSPSLLSRPPRPISLHIASPSRDDLIMLYVKTLLLALVSSVALIAAKDQLQVGVKYKPDECPLKTRKGDKLSMQ